MRTREHGSCPCRYSLVNRFAQLADECGSVDDGGHSSVVSGEEGGDLPRV